MVNPFFQGFLNKSISSGLTQKQAMGTLNQVFPASVGRAGLPNTSDFATEHATATLTPRNMGTPGGTFPTPANAMGAMKPLDLGNKMTGAPKTSPAAAMAGAAKITG